MAGGGHSKGAAGNAGQRSESQATKSKPGKAKTGKGNGASRQNSKPPWKRQARGDEEDAEDPIEEQSPRSAERAQLNSKIRDLTTEINLLAGRTSESALESVERMKKSRQAFKIKVTELKSPEDQVLVHQSRITDLEKQKATAEENIVSLRNGLQKAEQALEDLIEQIAAAKDDLSAAERAVEEADEAPEASLDAGGPARSALRSSSPQSDARFSAIENTNAQLQAQQAQMLAMFGQMQQMLQGITQGQAPLGIANSGFQMPALPFPPPLPQSPIVPSHRGVGGISPTQPFQAQSLLAHSSPVPLVPNVDLTINDDFEEAMEEEADNSATRSPAKAVKGIKKATGASPVVAIVEKTVKVEPASQPETAATAKWISKSL